MEKGATMIYFIQQGESGPIKIGYTKGKIKQRIQSLQTGNPEPLKILATMRGTVKDEINLHKAFDAHRLFGEWFDPSKDIMEYIQGLEKHTEVEMNEPKKEKPQRQKRRRLQNQEKLFRKWDIVGDGMELETILREPKTAKSFLANVREMVERFGDRIDSGLLTN